MIMYHLGPQLGVWIMQVSTFSSVPLYMQGWGISQAMDGFVVMSHINSITYL